MGICDKMGVLFVFIPHSYIVCFLQSETEKNQYLLIIERSLNHQYSQRTTSRANVTF
jgi:hypothetical protein